MTVVVSGCWRSNAPQGLQNLADPVSTDTDTQLPKYPQPDDSQSPGEDTLPTGWVDVQWLDSTIQVDIKYATRDNFVGEVLYPCERCVLRQEVAEALIRVHRSTMLKGYGIKVFDCYRPRPIQQLLWDKVPDAHYVTPPSKGSMHNRGVAVDVTLVDVQGRQMEMGTPYDFFGPEAHHTYQDLPQEVLHRRIFLRDEMAKEGFLHIRTEWWHYSLKGTAFELSDFMWPCL